MLTIEEYEKVKNERLLYNHELPSRIIAVETMEQHIEGLKNRIKYEPQDMGEVDLPKADPDYKGEGNGA